MIVFVLLALIFFVGAGISLVGLALWGLFDIDAGETLSKVGICVMICSVLAGIIVGIIMMCLVLFGIVFFI